MLGYSLEATLWIILAGACGCTFMIGRLLGERKVEQTVDTTLEYLMHNNMIRWQKREDGEIEILTLDE